MNRNPHHLRPPVLSLGLGLAALAAWSLPVWGGVGPGWFAPQGVPVPPRVSGVKAKVHAADKAQPGLRGTGPRTGVVDEISPRIAELARNLGNDPVEIYRFVRNHIEYVPYWGFLKGAGGVLYDMCGNDADQAALLVALVRAAGYEAHYRYGVMYIPVATSGDYDMAQWLDVEDSADAVEAALYRNGIPEDTYSGFTAVQRIWVEASVSGTVYQLDPAFKPHRRRSPVDLAAACGYDRDTLLAAAGGECDSNGVRQVNEEAVRSYLQDLCTSLVSAIETDWPNASIGEIAGNSEILPEEITSFPACFPFYTIVQETWDEPPSEYLHLVTLQHGAITRQFSTAELFGRRLAIIYHAAAGGEGAAENKSSLPARSGAMKAASPVLRPGADGRPLPQAAFQAQDTGKKTVGRPLEISAVGAVTEGSLSAQSEIWDFGKIRQSDYVLRSVTYRNTVSGKDMWLHTWIQNNYSGAFSYQSGGPGLYWISPWESHTITVKFSGSGQSPGYKSAYLYVEYYWDFNYRHTNIYYMHGIVAHSPDLSGSYGRDFGTTYVGESVDSTVRLKNSGSLTMSVTNYYIHGPDADQFQLLHGYSGALPAGNYWDYQVRYLGAEHGSQQAYLRIQFVYDDFPYYIDLNLKGRAAYPPDTSGSYGLNFGTIYYGEPATGECRFANSGSLNLQINSISLSGNDPSQFAIVSGGHSGTLPPGGHRDIRVKYLGSATGNHSAKVHINFTYDEVTYDWDYLPLQGETISRPQAEIWLEDTLLTQETAAVSGPTVPLVISVDHPYAAYSNNYMDQTVEFTLKRGARYAVISDFGGALRGDLLNHRRRILDEYRKSGLGDSDRSVFTETLNVLGQTWMRQTLLANSIMNQFSRTRRVYHHRFGIMAQEEGYYVDVKAQMEALVRRDSADSCSEAFRAAGLLSSALEHGVLEQTQGTNRPAASTVKLLQVANHTGQKIFLADSNNYAAIEAQLQNYSAEEKTNFAWRVSHGQKLLLPQNALIALGEWQGEGYVVNGPGADNSSEIGMIIHGDYYGGYSAYRGQVNVTETVHHYIPSELERIEHRRTPAADPVDLAKGAYTFRHEDLVVGDGILPRGLRLVRYYDSSQNRRRSPLGFGWTHSLLIRLQERSEGQAALGLRTPKDAAPLLEGSVVIADLMQGSPGPREWMVASLAAKWAVDELVNDAVSIQIGDRNLEFVRLPGNQFAAPPGVTTELYLSNGVYQLHERDGTVIEIGTNRCVSRWQDADGNQAVFEYDGRTNLTRVTDCYRRWLAFTYDAAGSNLVSASDSSGRTVSFGYTDGNLTSLTDPEGNQSQYQWDTNGCLMAVVDPFGRATVSNRYSAVSGMVLDQWNGAGHRWKICCVPTWRSFEENEHGDRRLFWYDRDRRPVGREDGLGHLWRYEYDGQNHLTNEIDPRGFCTLRQYDSRGRLTNLIDALGYQTSYTYDEHDNLIRVQDALGRITRMQYDQEHHLTNTTDALGVEEHRSYYPEGLLHQRQVIVSGQVVYAETYSYDAWGNPSEIIRTHGGRELHQYNPLGDLLSRTDANSNTTSWTYDCRRKRTSETDALGNTSSNVYDAAGRLVSEIDKRARLTLYTYTPTYRKATVTFPDGSVLSNTYDEADRLVLVRDRRGYLTSNRYDAAGRLVAVIDAQGHCTSNVYDEVGNLAAVIDPLGNTRSNIYDGLNRLVASMDPEGGIRSNRYDAAGNLIAVTDETGLRTEYGYDPLNRRILIRHPDGTEEYFGYDWRGNLTWYRNGRGASWSLDYDAMGRLTSSTNPLGTVKSFGYDAVGNRTNRVDRNNDGTFYYYDALNRRTNTMYGFFQQVHQHYDPEGNIILESNWVATVHYRYDSLQRLTGCVSVVSGRTFQVTYGYDPEGNLVQLTYPDSNVVYYAYDEAGRLITMTSTMFSGSFHFTYDAAGRLVELDYPNSVAGTWSYDRAGRITAYSYGKAGSNWVERTIQRDGRGWKVSEQVMAGLLPCAAGCEEHRWYDLADRAAGGGRRDHPPVEWKDLSSSYYAEGNEYYDYVHGQGESYWNRYYPWDKEIRPECRTIHDEQQGEWNLYYGYDAAGLRLYRRLEGPGTNQVQVYVYDRRVEPERVLCEYDGEGNRRSYVWGADRILAQVESDGTVYFFHGDELGSTLALSDTNGEVVAQYAYLPYGRICTNSSALLTPFLWLGGLGVYHEDVPLKKAATVYYMRHRFYDAGQRRFISPDPLGIDELLEREELLNLYAYARGNPLWFSDPLGLCAETRYWYDDEPAIVQDLSWYRRRRAGYYEGYNGEVLSPRSPGDYTDPNPVASELALAMGAPAPGFFDNTPAGEIAAMVPGAIAGGALTAAGVPALEFARDLSIAAAAGTGLSPEMIQAMQRFVEGAVSPNPPRDLSGAAGLVIRGRIYDPYVQPIIEDLIYSNQ